MNFLKNWTVSRKMWLLSGVLLANVLVVGGLSFWNSERLAQQLREVANIHLPAVKNMTLVDMMHDGLRAVAMNAIVYSGSGNNDEMADFSSEFSKMSQNMRTYLGNIGELSIPKTTQTKIDESVPLIEEFVKSGEIVVNLAINGKPAQAINALPPFENSFEKLEGVLGSLGDLIESDAQQSREKGESLEKAAKTTNIILIVAAVLIGFFFSFFLVRDLVGHLTAIIGRLASGAKELSETANNLKEASSELREASNQQASAIQETASSMEEITSMVNKTTENSSYLSQSVEESRNSTTKGQEAVRKMRDSVNTISQGNDEIMGQVTESNQKITEIVTVIGEIGEKTKIINDIVFQTKLLSFNASVEAARAGEHGKGFAVVAEEVGNLAQMSGNAAKEISTMLNDGIQRANTIVSETKEKVERLMNQGKENVSLGSTVAEECGTALGEIASQVDRVNDVTSQITSAIREQSVGNQEISKAIHLFNETTHKNASTAEQSSKIAEGLFDQVRSIDRLVDTLNSMVTGIDQDIELKYHAPGSLTHGGRDNVVHFPKKETTSPQTAQRPKSATSHTMAVGGEYLPSDDDPSFEDV